jgi:hypothetical protein
MMWTRPLYFLLTTSYYGTCRNGMVYTTTTESGFITAATTTTTIHGPYIFSLARNHLCRRAELFYRGSPSSSKAKTLCLPSDPMVRVCARLTRSSNQKKCRSPFVADVAEYLFLFFLLKTPEGGAEIPTTAVGRLWLFRSV